MDLDIMLFNLNVKWFKQIVFFLVDDDFETMDLLPYELVRYIGQPINWSHSFILNGSDETSLQRDSGHNPIYDGSVDQDETPSGISGIY